MNFGELFHRIKNLARRRGYLIVEVGVRAEWDADSTDEPWQWIAHITCSDTTASDTFETDQGSTTGPEHALATLEACLRAGWGVV